MLRIILKYQVQCCIDGLTANRFPVAFKMILLYDCLLMVFITDEYSANTVAEFIAGWACEASDGNCNIGTHQIADTGDHLPCYPG